MQIAGEISGLVPNSKDLNEAGDLHELGENEGFNECINLISPKLLEVVIDREKLAKFMADDDKNWDTDDQFRNYWLNRADIVLQRAKQDKDLVKIEVVK